MAANSTGLWFEVGRGLMPWSAAAARQLVPPCVLGCSLTLAAAACQWFPLHLLGCSLALPRGGQDLLHHYRPRAPRCAPYSQPCWVCCWQYAGLLCWPCGPLCVVVWWGCSTWLGRWSRRMLRCSPVSHIAAQHSIAQHSTARVTHHAPWPPRCSALPAPPRRRWCRRHPSFCDSDLCAPPLRRFAAPCPPRRALVPLTPGKPCVTKGKFTLLSYNLLADLYATVSSERRGPLALL